MPKGGTSISPLANENALPGFGYDTVKGHPAFAGQVFEQDVANQIQVALEKGDVPTAIKVVNGALTPLRATADISWLGQQGAGMWLRHPLKAANASARTILSAVGKPPVYQELIGQEARRGPGVEQLVRHGLDWTENFGEELQFPRKLTHLKVLGKVATFSNETFSRYLNYMRLTFANDAYERIMARAAKEGWDQARIDAEMAGAMRSVNRMSGRGIANPSNLEKAGLFAPKYFRASIEQLASTLGKGTSEEVRMARLHMARLLAFGGLFVVGVNELRGYHTDLNPTSYNFLKIRNLAGLDISPFGTYDTLFRYTAQALMGQAGQNGRPDPVGAFGNLVRSKLSPAASLINDTVFQQETYRGEPLDITSAGGVVKAITEEAKASLPFSVQNLAEEGPAAAAVGLTGLNSGPVTATEQAKFEQGGSHGQIFGRGNNGVAGELFGKPYGDLTGAEKAQVNQDPRVAEKLAAADAANMTRNDTLAKATQVNVAFRDAMAANARYLAAGKTDAGKPFTGPDYRDAYHDLVGRRLGALDALGQRPSGDPVVDGWFGLYDQAKLPNGQLDYDTLDELQAAYLAKHPDAQSRADAVTGVRDDATLRQLREAQKQAAAYYAIPRYFGMNAQKGEMALRALQAADSIMLANRSGM